MEAGYTVIIERLAQAEFSRSTSTSPNSATALRSGRHRAGVFWKPASASRGTSGRVAACCRTQADECNGRRATSRTSVVDRAPMRRRGGRQLEATREPGRAFFARALRVGVPNTNPRCVLIAGGAVSGACGGGSGTRGQVEASRSPGRCPAARGRMCEDVGQVVGGPPRSLERTRAVTRQRRQ